MALVIKKPTCQYRKHKRHGFDSWIRKIPWIRAWQPHSSSCAWKIPWIKKPGRLQSTGLQRVGHDWRDLACTMRGGKRSHFTPTALWKRSNCQPRFCACKCIPCLYVYMSLSLLYKDNIYIFNLHLENWC